MTKQKNKKNIKHTKHALRVLPRTQQPLKNTTMSKTSDSKIPKNAGITEHLKPNNVTTKTEIEPPSYQKKLALFSRWFGIPALVYLVSFTAYAWTWMSHFNTRFFTDQGDGFQNVWNIWWINKSVTELHQLPWHTTLLHYPEGTTLIAQTLNPFNGFVGIVLQKVFSLVQTYNIMIIFSFVMTGVTMFWLCHFFTKKYIPSLIGGFIFTFSSYHFAHAIGHMQLVSLEWVPLFVLLWWRLLTKPRYQTAIGAAIVLCLVLLCDYYYFMYSVVGATMILIYLWRAKRLAPFRVASAFRPWLVFIVISLVISAPLPFALLRTNAHDVLIGSHDSRVFSTDLFSTVIDGGFWHFASLTSGYWHSIKAYVAESSVYFGVSVIVLIVIALRKRNKLNPDTNFWLVLGAIFGILSLGPRLMIHGYSINHAPLPYAILEHLFPQIKLSGVPNRMIVMTSLAAAIISAIVLARLNLRQRKGQLLAGLFMIVLAIEMWPGILPTNIANQYPKYLDALAKLPNGAVIDNGAVSQTWQLYGQTVTGKPIAFGYISRTPTSVNDADWQLTAAILREQYPRVCNDFHIRYLTTPASRPAKTDLPQVYNDKSTIIYDLKSSPGC